MLGNAILLAARRSPLRRVNDAPSEVTVKSLTPVTFLFVLSSLACGAVEQGKELYRDVTAIQSGLDAKGFGPVSVNLNWNNGHKVLRIGASFAGESAAVEAAADEVVRTVWPFVRSD